MRRFSTITPPHLKAYPTPTHLKIKDIELSILPY